MDGSGFVAIVPHPPIVVPEVGGARSSVTRASSEALHSVGDFLLGFDPELVVIMSPHAPMIHGRFLVDDAALLSGSLREFGDSRMLSLSGSPRLARGLVELLTSEGIPAASRSDATPAYAGELDHGCLVPLQMLGTLPNAPFIVLSLSDAGLELHRRMGEALARYVHGAGLRTAFIASGDLSHRLTPDAPAGYDPDAFRFDETVIAAVRDGDLEALISIDPALRSRAGECGLRSIVTAGGFLGHGPVPSTVLSYEAPWGVGYLTALLGAIERSAAPETSRIDASEDTSEIVGLARSAIESWIRTGRRLSGAQLCSPEYPARAGSFVSLHARGELRGCIGTIDPVCSTLAEEVARNAVEAAVHDPRFPPLQEEELRGLEISVDVLEEPHECSFDQLDPKTFGVIVSSGFRRGLLLPDLEGVDDAATQVAIARRKAGIGQYDEIELQRFRVHRYT